MTAPTLREAAQAPTKVRAEARECPDCGHIGINDSHDTLAACNHCEWSGPSPKEDHCPECERDGTMCLACPECGGLYKLVAECDISVDRAALTQAADAGAAEVDSAVDKTPDLQGSLVDKTANLQGQAGAAEPVAYRVRYRAEPGMIGHYPWSYIEVKRAKHQMEAHEYEALYTAPPAQQLQQAVAREREACRAACEAIADEYQRREGHKYPELKSDAQTGADDCERAISARGNTHGL